MTSEVKRTFVVVSHTHWDREWYQPFEEFRTRLVRMMDALLDLFDSDPEYRHFVLDGQTVPLDDYLEVRPDRRADIQRLVREGRLLAGPNYILPDEFLIGAEAWVRNLMVGIRSARAYGRAMMVGYSPDAFGHIAHLPAILRGFGIDSVLIWRGVGREATTSEFRWAAPDGSEVLAIHFPYGYGLMAALPEEREALAAGLKVVRGLLEPLATTRFVLIPNGTDHLPAHTGLSRVIRLANELLDGSAMVHGDYPLLVESIKKELGARYDALPLLTGEFRNSQRSNILPGVLSTRMWAKQRYQECEDLLARYTEPAVAWSQLLGAAAGAAARKAASDRGLLLHAWKLLLQNGPHDSVTGCSVDAVYDDVRLRFNRCQQTAQTLLLEAQRHIATLAAPQGQSSVAVFNPEHGPRTDFCTVRLPADGAKLPARLVDSAGRETPVQLTERGGYSPRDPRERVTAAFVAPDVPGFGYRVYRVEYAEPAVGPRAGKGSAIENEYFRVEAGAQDGTLTVTDKRSGVVLSALNRFVDGGERGDEYTYCPPEQDFFVDQPAAPPSIRILEDGPVRWTLEVSMAYSLPAGLSEDRQARADGRVDCEIVSRVSLYPGIARIDIETEVDNRAGDHRLRVHFPSGLAADHSCAEQHFGVVQRPVGLPEYDGTWMETPMPMHPQKTFVDVSDGGRGLMIANRGLPDYEALRENRGTVTIALTLLRCVGWLSRGDLTTRRQHAGPAPMTPGAQMIGRWSFHYSLIPHTGGWENACAEAHRFARPLRALSTLHGAGALPPEGALVSVEPTAAIVSAIKPAEEGDGVVVRLYNISPEAITARLRLNAPYAGVERVDLNEEHPQPVSVHDGGVQLPLRTNEIVSVKFKWA
ncbi:MAG: glycoside hydrolase family 38 C-terminal domain-containing protein [Dehalococcoidia bacterium]|nr:glycoside hydrolase family 38 C-terminal domain-containing protein [Dehalococcoidia bacterium]